MTRSSAGVEDAVTRASALGVSDVLEQQAAQYPHAVAVECWTGTSTYTQFTRAVERAARLLRAEGVHNGDRVAVLSENRRELLVMLFACARSGAILACLNWRQAPAELAHCCSLVSPKLLFASERFAEVARTLRGGSVPVVTWDDAAWWERELPGAGDSIAAGRGEDGLYILYTSGTTGFPKAALISHRAAIARTFSLALERPLPRRATYVAWAPLFHMGAMDASQATLLTGGKVVVMDGFDAERLARIVVREEIGHLNIVPGVVDRFLEALRKQDAGPKRVAMVGVMADLVPPRLLADLTRSVGAPYCNTFGSTETGSAPASRGLLEPGAVPRKLSKVQNAFCAVRLVDEEGREVARGEPGELTMRGPTLFSGYWGDPAATEEVFQDGWYHMGDMFVRNEEGTLDFVERRKYLIKSGGENIYPAEVERALRAVPGVADAVVVKAPDAKWGEVPVAFVVPVGAGLTSQAVIDGCRGSIAGYKLPRRVLFATAAALPRNVSGKVERLKLERYLAQCGAAAEHLPEGVLA